MLLVGYLYGIKSETRLEEEVNYNIAYKWFCGLELTQKAPDATTISQNRRRRFRENNIAEQIFNGILRQCVEKGLVGGAILYTDSTHIKAKANKHKKTLVEVAVTPKAYLAELDAQVDQEREELGKKPFERDGDEHKGGGSAKRMQSTTDPESGQQSRDGKPNGFYYSEHRTVDSKRNVIVNVHVEPANINDVTPMTEILDEIEARLGELPRYMGLDAGYHNAGIAHLLERKGIQGVIGYRRHTYKGAHYGKYRFRYDPGQDEYICPEKQRLTWKNTTREGYRQYCCESKICKGCPRRGKCFGASMSRKVVERHVWQEALDRVNAFTKTYRGKRIYSWRKETIERSFAEAKENHGLRYARMLGIANTYRTSRGWWPLCGVCSCIYPLHLHTNAGVCQWSARSPCGERPDCQRSPYALSQRGFFDSLCGWSLTSRRLSFRNYAIRNSLRGVDVGFDGGGVGAMRLRQLRHHVHGERRLRAAGGRGGDRRGAVAARQRDQPV